jgi:hypothetical protein
VLPMLDDALGGLPPEPTGFAAGSRSL